MRTYSLSPALIAATRRRALAAPAREVGLPLYLEAPRHDGPAPTSLVEYDAEDARIEAGGFTIGTAEDDDFH